MPLYHRPSRDCMKIVIAGALVFCFSFLMCGVFDFMNVRKMEREWIEVDALIIGMSTYLSGGDGDVKKYHCPQVEFKRPNGRTITAVSKTSCVLVVDGQWTNVIGSYIPIVYNPENPGEFIKQEDLQAQLQTQVIVEAVGGSVCIILCCILCRLLQRQRRDRPPADLHGSSTRSTPEIPPEERKERILSRLYLLTVPEDSCKIAASSIRSMGRLDSTDKTTIEGSEDSENGDHGNNEMEQEQEDSITISDRHHHGVSSTISSFWSSLIRSNHDAECCICLDHYEPGEVVCASKSEECNHVFHKECLLHWMMKNNDRCPLCRVDFMKDEEEGK